MFGTPYGRSNNDTGSSAPLRFKDSARNAVYLQLLPLIVTSTGASSIRSAPSQVQRQKDQGHFLQRSLISSVFSSGKRSVRSAPSIYSNSTATIPEDSEPLSVTVEQLVSDIALHELTLYERFQEKVVSEGRVLDEDFDESTAYKISLGSDLQYQNVPESLIDWNLNVTRCKLIVTQMPSVSSVPDSVYSTNSFPQLVGDLAKLCHIMIIQPHITDKELIYTLFASNLYQEHNLDMNFKKSVAEISVKQSRLLQLNSRNPKGAVSPITHSENQASLKFKFKEIAIRNYLINLAAAATTAYEYKIKHDEIRSALKLSDGKKKKLSKEEKKRLWDLVRSDVFKRAGLEE